MTKEPYCVLLESNTVIKQEFIPEECDPLADTSIIKKEFSPQETTRIELLDEVCFTFGIYGLSVSSEFCHQRN